jgi:sugar lactone lactonase YvrE
MKLYYFLAVTAMLSLQMKAQLTIEKKWESESLFKVPESVCLDIKNNVLYVSNINGSNVWAKDNNGSIGKMRPDGTILQAEWIRGLHSPKGMGLFKDLLYVADLTEIVVIDISRQEIRKKIPVPYSEQLNDITIDTKGNVYVSDSKSKRVYVLKGGDATPYLEGLEGPNGILWLKDNLYLLDRGSLYRVEYDRKLTKLADGIEGGADGLAAYNDAGFIVSGWAGVIYYVSPEGAKQLLIDTRSAKMQSADIAYEPASQTLFVPAFFSNKVVAYSLK